MSVPPNILPLVSAIGATSWADDYANIYSMLVCPICSFEYTHIGEPRKVSGNENYEAWPGRGDLLVIPFSGECGSKWEICFGFHKGNTNVFVRIRKACNEDSYLYFIEAVDSGFIKIGRSLNPELRLKQLEAGSPNQLVILGKVSGGSELEAELHKRFSAHRERGEWFRATRELRDFIKEATA